MKNAKQRKSERDERVEQRGRFVCLSSNMGSEGGLMGPMPSDFKEQLFALVIKRGSLFTSSQKTSSGPRSPLGKVNVCVGLLFKFLLCVFTHACACVH